MTTAALPLEGVRVLELAGLAPGPFAGMVLADFGADVVRVDRAGTSFNVDVLARGKRSISVSLKVKEGVELIRDLLSSTPAGCSNPACKCSRAKQSTCPRNSNWRADVLIDPFRPGVLERLGLGPDVLLKRNPRLIIARLTGFRRYGPYSKMAGHDINYVALSGVLSMLGRKGEKPYAPANIAADFAGGGMMAVLGVMAAIIERYRSGLGQVVEADMVTGTRYVSAFPLLMSRPSIGVPMWDQPRGENILDGGCPWYDTYETKDGKYMSLGAIESPFYAEFLKLFVNNLPDSLTSGAVPRADQQMDRSTWSALEQFFTAGFKTKTREEWTRVFVGTDACCVPVLEPREVDARGHGHDEPDFNREDGQEGGVPSAAPALSRTPAKPVDSHSFEYFLEPGQDTIAVLRQAGYDDAQVKELLKKKAVESSDEIESIQSKL